MGEITLADPEPVSTEFGGQGMPPVEAVGVSMAEVSLEPRSTSFGAVSDQICSFVTIRTER